VTRLWLLMTRWWYVCRDGVSLSDRFIALSNARDMIASEQQIDIFEIVYNIKQAQPHFFKNLVS